MNAICGKDLKKAFGGHIIFQKLNLDVQTGEFVGIMGKSGCGKSTLLNILGLIEGLDQGCLTLFGDKAPNPDSSSAAKLIRRKIGYLFQNFALINNERVEENLCLAFGGLGLTKGEQRLRIGAALAEVGLSGFELAPVYSLSGGEQQRVALARILVNPKALILADEPTGSVDPLNRDRILALLRRMNKGGATIVLVTHDPIVGDQCGRIIRLD